MHYEATERVTFTVNPVNDLPVVTGIPDQTIAEGQNFSQISLDAFVADGDHADDLLTWTALGQSDITVIHCKPGSYPYDGPGLERN